ncbi:MAG: class I SAM-dependent rRNA methyltransferase [Rhodobacteraceae bacterium]|nr:class I SAM-dependent rRNA methyltransferase [Paracoccaceae bacterium]
MNQQSSPDEAAEPSPPQNEPVADHARPTLKLRPKTGGRFFAGAPWVYVNELAMDRRARALQPGAIVDLADAERELVATVAVNPNSKIACRALERRPGVEIDVDWFTAKLSAALALRERLFEAPYYRLIHAEADGLPGLIIDRFGPVLAVQPNAAWLEIRRTALLAAIDRVIDPETVIWNGTSRARALEGLPEETRLLKGVLDGSVAVPMNGATYLADVLGGQKTGLFFDQRPTHRAVADLSAGRDILDVFAHVGGFGLAALAAGATRATLIDGSEAALELARAGADRMGVVDRVETLRSDAFDAMRALSGEGRRFELVVCDPPAFAPNRAAREAGLRAYAKTARFGAALTAPGGIFTLCSCSHAVSIDELRDVAAKTFRMAGRGARLLRVGGAGPDHPIHPHLPETEYLKSLIYMLD